VATLLFRGIKISSGLHRFGGVTATTAAPAKRVYLPLVYRNYGYHSAWNTRIIIMNTSASRAACIHISYWTAGGGASALATVEPPGHPRECISIPPLGTFRKDVIDVTALGNQWLGSVMVDVAGSEDAESKQILVANAETWNKEKGNFSSYSGICWRVGITPSYCSANAGASTNLLLPLIYRSYGYLSQWETYLMIQTHDNITRDNVMIDFKGTVNGAPFETTYGPLTVATSRICYLALANPADSCSGQTTNGPIPSGFIGSAQVREPTNSVPLAAVATRYSSRAQIQSSYTAFWERFVNPTTPPASYDAYLPLIYRTYGWKGNRGNAKAWNSWFQVQVADGSTAQLTVTYYPDDGNKAAIVETATITGSGALYQYLNSALGNGFIGSARIQSDKPIAVIASVGNDAYVGDADASYEGVPP
jgi:hypothetical protein